MLNSLPGLYVIVARTRLVECLNPLHVKIQCRAKARKRTVYEEKVQF